MKLLISIALVAITISCDVRKNSQNSLNDKEFLDSGDYNYQKLTIKKYGLIIKRIMVEKAICGTRTHVAELIGNTSEYGDIRLLIPCYNLEDKEIGDTIYFLPIEEPNQWSGGVVYLKEHLSELEIEEIINIPTVFAKIIND